MSEKKHIWVLLEITRDEKSIGKLSLGLLTEAVDIAARVDGAVTAVFFGEKFNDYSKVLSEYGVNRNYFFKNPEFQYLSAEIYAVALWSIIYEEKPWLFLVGDTAVGRELLVRLAALLKTGLVMGCVKIDLNNTEKPIFYRPVYAGQLWQEVVPETSGTMLAAMDPACLNVRPAAAPTSVETRIIEAELASGTIKTQHLEFLPADLRKADIADARTIVGAGMGAIAHDLFPMVEELATLLEGVIGTTRPVVDEGIIARERLIGQTGRVVNPDLYLALGISGASHHVGGIQESGKIVAINRDPQANIFKNADAGAVADLRDVLPKLIARIRRAKVDGEIL